MKKIHKILIVAGIFLLAADFGRAQTASQTATESKAAHDARIAWWREARFGMFIHYGPVSLTGKEISWSRANSNTNCPNHGPTPVVVYDNLYKHFDPTNFNADEWAGIAKAAGMKYMIFVAKHGDGFLMWNCKVDPYNIGKSAFTRDFCTELSQAARKAGLRFGFYFSPMDWRDPDCRSQNNDRFVVHMQDELRELLTNYGKIDVMWFDSDGRPTMWHPETTYPLVKSLQPQIIIDNRLQLDTGEEWAHQEKLKLRANEDFYTPEQKVGAYDERQPWESCITLGTQWSWKPNDNIKSAAEVVGILAQTAGGDGNLLLDLGPMPDGRIEPRQVEVLNQVGAWMDVNGESIYSTRGGPWKPTKQIASTRKGNAVYVFVLKQDQTTVELPALPKKIISASVLGGGPVDMDTRNEKVVLHLPPRQARTATVIKLLLDGSAMDIKAIILPMAVTAGASENNSLPPASMTFSTSNPNPRQNDNPAGAKSLFQPAYIHANKLEEIFRSPPTDARPWVYWFWMGSTITADGITGDLQALHDAGFGGSVMCSMADICSPWPAPIANAPTPDIITFNDKWWRLVRYAAQESHRLGLQFGIGNCAGYETCGGPWVSPEYSMQEVVWSETKFTGPGNFSGTVPRPAVDIHAHMPFPVYIGNTGKLAKPEVPARKTFFRDIAVLAVPASGVIPTSKIFDLSGNLSPEGKITWDAPAGDWVIYRFGHTTMGSMIQPCQWEAIGLQADMMSREAMAFNLDHLTGEIHKHAGDLVGKGLNFVWFDSYEAGTPTWTPQMREEFQARRGYDLTKFLPVLAKRTVGDTNKTKRFNEDFNRTVQDLYRDVYFSVIPQKLHAAGLDFCNEPYWGPWKIPEVITNVDHVVAEFWQKNKDYDASAVPEVVSAARAHGLNLISAEAFTAWPKDSQWNETPAGLKAVGDAAFCDGINHFVLHRYVHQPYGDKYKPGIAMGQWGTQFDRTQTWWPQFKAMVKYWQRCDALLQWGAIATNDFATVAADPDLRLKAIHRRDGSSDIYFVANLAHQSCAAKCAFGVVGKQPELWDPVTGKTRDLPQHDMADGKTIVPLQFCDSQSWFVVFRKPLSGAGTFASAKNFPELKAVDEISGTWSVQFDSKWGGPNQPVEFATLENWTNRAETGIKYYSGTADYKMTFDLPDAKLKVNDSKFYLDLGEVRDLAEVSLNGHDLGVVWTVPWRVDVSKVLKAKKNHLSIKVTNCWANRQIGDEQMPADCEFGRGSFGYGGPLKSFPDWLIKNQPRRSGRFTFATWNYFDKDSPLESSGLLGPVKLLQLASVN